MIKLRNPLQLATMVLFTLATYQVYWWYLTKTELNELGGQIPKVEWGILPGLHLYFAYNHSEAFFSVIKQTSAGSTMVPSILTVLLLHIPILNLACIYFMQDSINKYITEHGKINVSDARTLFNSSRKYVLPLLEHMDEQRITKRVGDERKLR